MLALQRPHLVLADEREPELAVVDSLGPQHPACELDRAGLVDLDAASVVDLDRDHRVALLGVLLVGLDDPLHELVADDVAVAELDEADAVDPASTSRTCIRPDRWSRGRSICVTSPVTTTFEPKPSRVRNICICSGEVFCASSRMMKLSFSVRPRMNASGATSIVPRSIR